MSRKGRPGNKQVGVKLAVLRCTGRNTVGERCTNNALPGTRRCGRHSVVARERLRCHHVFDDGFRCELAVYKGTDYCVAHQRRTLCSEHLVTTGEPCPLVAGPTGRCKNHARLPTEEDRCVHVFENGARCPATVTSNDRCKRHQMPIVDERPRGPDGRLRTKACSGCGAATTARNGVCAACAPPPPLCGATTAAGTACKRAATTPEGTCAAHTTAATAKTPDPTARRQRCDVTVGKGEGRRCRGWATENGRCSRHQHEVPEEDRCVHVYGDGSRCWQQHSAAVGNGTGDLCPTHRIACEGGCGRKVADTTYPTCQHCRPGCRQLVGDGTVCGKPVNPHSDRCMVHDEVPDDACRCEHRFGDDSRCAATATHGQLCSQHRIECGVEGCEALTQYSDARCRSHRGRCARCERPAHIDGLCGHHHSLETYGLCVLRTIFDTPCTLAGTVETAEGRICGRHHNLMPAEEDRCVHVYGDGSRCAAARFRHYRWCGKHIVSVPCPVVLADGTPCGNACLHLPDGSHGPRCVAHDELPGDDIRCRSQVADGQRCPERCEPRRDHCRNHLGDQTRCVAIRSDGHRCRRPAPSGHDTCDEHENWDNTDPFHDPEEAYMRFFVRPNIDVIWALSAEMHGLDGGLTREDVPSELYCPQVDTSTYRQGDMPTWALDYDRYDLTGARRLYAELIDGGMSEEQASKAAELAASKLAANTVKTLTAQLGPYLAYCEEHMLVPVPASMPTIAGFLAHIAERGRLSDGQPLSTSTLDKMRTGISKLHTVAEYTDPFTEHPALAGMLAGYNRLYSRPQLQAHAIRVEELASLLAAATSNTGTTVLRDTALITVVTDPEVGMGLKAAAKLNWDDIIFSEDSATITVPGPKGRSHVVPSRIAEPLHDGSLPAAARLCGVAALRALAAQRTAAGQSLSGPVFRKADDADMTPNGLRKAITKACEAAEVSYAPKLSFDDRLAALDAITGPSLIGIRDAAVMAISWWASLRREEVANLRVGDIGGDAQGRGLVVLVRKSKTDSDGQYVPVPHAVRSGKRLPIDLQHNLHRWLDAYTRLLGRELTDDDPLFCQLHKDVGCEMRGEAIGQVIKRWAKGAGVTAELGERISSHGFRAGYATEWLSSGRAAEPLARRQRRKSTGSLLGYFRLADPFEDSLSFVLDVPSDIEFDLEKLLAEERRRQG